MLAAGVYKINVSKFNLKCGYGQRSDCKRQLLLNRHAPPCPSGISAGLTDSGQEVRTVSAAKPVILVQRAGFPPAMCVIGNNICYFLVQILNNWMMGHKGE